MATWLTKETAALEGACGQILAAKEAGVVIKRMHRQRVQRHRAKGLGAQAQCAMQQWASALLVPANGFSILFTPKAWLSPEPEERSRQYAMEQIDCSTELNPCSLSTTETTELKLFYEKAQAAGIFPCDYELYKQADGRIGLIDFDKFGRFVEGQVILPWGATMSPIYPFTS